MALTWAFFALAIVWVVSTLNALRPPHWGPASVPAFFAGWVVSELPLVHLVAQAIATGLFLWGGALQGWPGIVALICTGASWVGLIVLEASSVGSWRHVEAAFGSSTPGPAGGAAVTPARPTIPWHEARIPVPRRTKGVEKIRNIDYWGDNIPPHRLDIYRPAGTQPADRRPVMLYIHGGAWILGDKREQGRPMLHHLARQGWVGVSINYRLSPRSPWPDHIIDCKKALAWVREHIAEYGGDPSRIVVSGGSAGGHLAALVALTPGDPDFQPGFEDADTTVSACIPFYGVYDFTNDGRVFDKRFVRFLERLVFKTTIAENRELFEKASPYWRIHPDAPPFLAINGRNDTLVPAGEPRRFIAKLREVSAAPVVHVELPFTQHAFEIFPTVRTGYAVRCIERFFTQAEESAANR